MEKLITYFSQNHSAGDWYYFHLETISLYTFYPYIWSTVNGNGLGQNIAAFLGFKTFISLVFKLVVHILNIRWETAELIMFFVPFLIFSACSSYILSHLWLKNKLVQLGSVLIYVFNTYSLMTFTGGQMGVALAYSIFPLVIYLYIIAMRQRGVGDLLLFTLSLALILIFDIRIAYIAVCAVGIYWIIIQFSSKRHSIYDFLNDVSRLLILPISLALLINLFWILPTVLFSSEVIEGFGLGYINSKSVNYFSFANLENTISLLHPNWPTNIFGQVAFMRWEFIIFSVLAYSSFLYISYHKYQIRVFILFFGLLGLTGSFLAKGSNDPFGLIYIYAFDNIPGFSLFRDPLKWYVLIAMSYSVLVPFGVYNLYILLKNKLGRNVPQVFMAVIMLWTIYILSPLFSGQVVGILQAKVLPNEYIRVKELLNSHDSFFRTMWVPKLQRYGFYDAKKPAVDSENLYTNQSFEDLSKVLNASMSAEMLSDLAVRYIIVPFDSQGEIFLEDRRYSEEKYKAAVDAIRNISYLREIEGFGKIKVFEVPNPRDHLYFLNSQGSVEYRYVNPTKYELTVQNASKNDVLVFSERFDSGWELQLKNKSITSKPYRYLLNSYVLSESGTYSATLYYTPQDYVNRGIFVSGITFISILGTLGYLHTKRKARKHGH